MRSIFLSLRCIVACSILSLLFSCEHRHLEDPVNTHYVRVYLDEQIKNVTCGFYNDTLEKPEYERPIALRAILANPQTGEIVSERILRNHGDDGRGHYIDGHIAAPAGVYNILFHTLGSSITHIGMEYNFHEIYAYTNQLSGNTMQYLPSISDNLKENNVKHQPEHIFHNVYENITVNNSQTIDTIKTNNDYFEAHSMVKSYFLQIKIKGIQWVSSAVSLMSGMAGSSKVNSHNSLIEADSVNIFIPMKHAKNMNSRIPQSTDILYATFNTFGKLADVSTIYTLNFEFIKTDGTSQVERLDITPMFSTPIVMENRWILLDKEIHITPPNGAGGVTPGVEGWKDIDADVVI